MPTDRANLYRDKELTKLALNALNAQTGLIGKITKSRFALNPASSSGALIELTSRDKNMHLMRNVNF